MEFSRNGVQFHGWWFNPLLCRHNELTTKPMDVEYGRPCMLGHVLPRPSEWQEGRAPLWIQWARAYWALTSSSGYCHLHICPAVKQKVNCLSDFVCTDSEGGSPQSCSWLTVHESIMGQPSFTAGIWSRESFWGLSFTWSTTESHFRVILEGRRWIEGEEEVIIARQLKQQLTGEENILFLAENPCLGLSIHILCFCNSSSQEMWCPLLASRHWSHIHRSPPQIYTQKHNQKHF